MIVVAVILVTLAVCLALINKLKGSFGAMVKWLRHTEDRVSSLEVKDYAQDVRLDNHQKSLSKLKTDVKELGADVGWDDDLRKTQVIRDNTPPDDDNTP